MPPPAAGSRPFAQVVCVGLDGATFDVIDSMVERGRLPTLGKLLSTGVRANLASTVPPLSAPAWVSFMTGANPGRHGVFHFMAMDNGALGSGLVGSWEYRGRTIFDHASRAGLEVLAFRVPMTYPPWPVNGIMVSGFPTPDPRSTYSHPQEVGADIGPLLKLSPMRSMVSDVDAQASNFDYYLARSTDALTGLMSRDADLVCYVNSITDWIAHKFWRFSDPSAPGYEPHPMNGSTPLEYFYEKTDESLGQILAASDSDALVIVLSDHGTGPRTRRRFSTNAWLSGAGMLQRSAGKRGKRLASSALEWGKDMVPKKYWLWRHSPGALRRTAGALRAYGGAIEWDRSEAYGVRIDHHVEGINVNLRGREPHGCVDERDYEATRTRIIHEASRLTDPKSGAKVFERVCKREDVYWGQHAHLAPDVVLILDPTFEFGIGAERNPFTEVATSRLGRSSATHRPDGILSLTGPGTRRGVDLGRASLLDVPATILWALGLELPPDVDGKVLHEAFDQDVVAAHPVRRGTTTAAPVAKGAYSEEEERQMAAHLQDLGYM